MSRILHHSETSQQPTEGSLPSVVNACHAILGNAAEQESVSTAASVPDVLQRSRFAHHLQEYIRQFQPVGHLENVVVRDLARQTAAMEVWGEGVVALQRQRAQRVPELVLSPGDDEGELADVALAAAVSAPDILHGEQHSQRRTRAFYRSLRTLADLQARRTDLEVGAESSTLASHFLTEAACNAYLHERLKQGVYRCPKCGHTHGHYISARRCWECANCKRQAGLRANTVMADSPLPLVVWFMAIRLLLWRPATTTAELATKLNITRPATVRNVAGKIRAAMAAENTSDLLAGLDVYYARCDATAPESTVHNSSILESAAAYTKCLSSEPQVSMKQTLSPEIEAPQTPGK